jgi:hypothetical protein
VSSCTFITSAATFPSSERVDEARLHASHFSHCAARAVLVTLASVMQRDRMPRVRGTCLRMLAFVAVAAVAPDATAAGFDVHHGALCNPATSADSALISYDIYGPSNTSSTVTANVACGLAIDVGSQTPSDPTVPISVVSVGVYDRNAAQDICCTAYVQDWDANIVTSSSNCSQGSSNNGKLIIISVAASSDAFYVSVMCGIPPTTAMGASQVTAYHAGWL